ncbi:MAG: MFS transporter [Actinomycetota bacterium]|nr:MFS transporter [Actinomycetota bacterium]
MSASRKGLIGIGFAFAVTMVGTTLPTPLYPLYRQQLSISNLTITVIYAVYAAGVLVALLLLGELSDRIGRRPVLLAGVALSALSAVIFLVQDGLTLLLIGRVLSGLSAGLFTGTATAAMVELVDFADRSRATFAATVVNMGGLGLGPLLAGLVAQYVGYPLRTVFVVDLVLLVPAAVLLWAAPETVKERKGFRLHVTRVAVPTQVRAQFVRASVIGFAGFVVLGLFGAVIPSALGQLIGIHDRAAIGATVFLIFFGSVLGQAGVERLSLNRAMALGCLLLAAGMGVLATALGLRSMSLIVAAAMVAGIGQGLSFRAGLMLITGPTPADQRGEVTSALFTVLYVGISLPIVGVGLADRAWGLQHTGMVTTGLVAILALLILASSVKADLPAAVSSEHTGSPHNSDQSTR